MIKASLRALVMTGAALALTLSSAQAYEVAPMRVTLVPSQGQRGSSVSINNNEKRPLQVEIKIFLRSVAEDGSQTLDPADDDFTVFPPQVEIPAGKSQSIRFQYVGPPIGETSMAYVVQVVELPVTTPDFSGVRFTYNFGVAVYLDPPRATDKMRVVTAERHNDGIRLRVHNDGTRYGVVSWKRVVAEFAGRSLELTPEMLGQRIANPLVPPRADRVIDIAMPEWTDVATTGPVSAKLLEPNG